MLKILSVESILNLPKNLLLDTKITKKVILESTDLNTTEKRFLDSHNKRIPYK